MKIKAFVQQSPVVGIMATQLKLNAYLTERLKAVGLNYVEALVLATLFFEDKAKDVGPSQIARTILYPLPRISAAISVLHEEGLLLREFAKADSRKTRLLLSSRGQKRAVQVVGIFNEIQEAIEGVVSESQALSLNRSLLRLRAELFA